eukprot:gene17950-21379_t
MCGIHLNRANGNFGWDPGNFGWDFENCLFSWGFNLKKNVGIGQVEQQSSKPMAVVPCAVALCARKGSAELLIPISRPPLFVTSSHQLIRNTWNLEQLQADALDIGELPPYTMPAKQEVGKKDVRM